MHVRQTYLFMLNACFGQNVWIINESVINGNIYSAQFQTFSFFIANACHNIKLIHFHLQLIKLRLDHTLEHLKAWLPASKSIIAN